MHFFCILDGIRNYPQSPPIFSKPFSVSDWILLMKLILALMEMELQFILFSQSVIFC